MVDDVKVLIAEVNGVDLEDSAELDLRSYILLAQIDHHAGFSELIPSQEVEIGSRKQMRVSGPFIMCGMLIVNGALVVD